MNRSQLRIKARRYKYLSNQILISMKNVAHSQHIYPILSHIRPADSLSLSGVRAGSQRARAQLHRLIWPRYTLLYPGQGVTLLGQGLRTSGARPTHLYPCTDRGRVRGGQMEVTWSSYRSQLQEDRSLKLICSRVTTGNTGIITGVHSRYLPM